MSDTPDIAPPTPPAATAGSLLRQARQAQGMHIAVLATAIKVAPRKLDALENDRLDELPDATFTRALAQTVCRTLKIDPAPVLALLPPPPGHRLAQVGEGINAPFRDRPGMSQGSDWSLLGSPAVWAPLLFLVLAGIVYFLPPGTLSIPTSQSASAPAATASRIVSAPAVAPAPIAAPLAAAPAPAASVVVETVHSVPPAAVDDAASSATSTAAGMAGVLQLRVAGESWVEVLDGRGQTLLSRLLQPGEAVGVDGSMPLKVTIGNAGVTQLSFRGKPIELAGFTRDNVARLDLK
jgi:cytoskeleton protein RodZ